MQPLIVSYSGIRGVAGESLTSEVAARFGAAFGELVARRRRHAKPTVLLGRDTRPSGLDLLEGAARGLAPSARLVDLGVVPTPTLQFALGALAADGGLCITASHNPRRWNGMKFFLAPDRTVLGADETRELADLAATVARAPSPGGGAAPARVDRGAEAIRLHVAAVSAEVDAARIRARRFRVALDAGGGAGAEPTRMLLAALGCDVVVVDADRESEPVPEHLDALRRAVAAERCDLGLAQDLDADRLALVTDLGEAPGEEQTLVLVVDHLLRRFPDGARTVVKNVATTRAIDDVTVRHGAALVVTPVGEVNLSRALLAAGRRGEHAFGGEGNGGVIYPPISPGRDSLAGAALVLERLTADARPLSDHLSRLPRYHMKKARLPLPAGETLGALLARVVRAFPHGTSTRRDGLEIEFPDGAWLAVRASNTEPVLRAVVESRDPGWTEAAMARIERLAGG